MSGVTTIFVTDADNREVLEYNGSTGQIQAWYAYGLGSNEVLNRMDVPGGTRQTLIPDIQGSFLGTLDSGTGTLAKRGYLPFGESPTTSGTFAYTGLRIDPETNGLYYARARIYSPRLGRFVQPDPIGYAGGSNLYAYVGNDPLNLVDRFGLAAEAQMAGAGAQGDASGGSFMLAQAGRIGSPTINAQIESAIVRGDTQQLLRILPGASSEQAALIESVVARESLGTSIRIAQGQVQHAFSRAAEFGVRGAWNPARGGEFSVAIERHVADAGTRAIHGWYMNQPATIFVNPQSGLTVVRSAAGEFVTAYRARAGQLSNILSRGRLGGN